MIEPTKIGLEYSVREWECIGEVGRTGFGGYSMAELTAIRRSTSHRLAMVISEIERRKAGRP